MASMIQNCTKVKEQAARNTVMIQRQAPLPDMMKLARYFRSPDLGPRLLFFSGGTALRDLSSRLIGYTHNSIHLMTPFDSGGSSAVLRQAFNMLAIGDIRFRLMSLADQTLHGNPDIFTLFAYRFNKTDPPKELTHELSTMISGRHRLVKRIPDPMRKIIRHHLRRFDELMPKEFDLRGASIGNLILTAGYLDSRRHPDQVIYIFSKLVEVRGTVRPILNGNYHVSAELDNGRLVEGQRQITGKEVPGIDSPVRRLFLTNNEKNGKEVQVPIRKKVRDIIKQAELICFPMGSFYTSLVATLLPEGVGQAICRTPCPKVYIPSMGNDPEAVGMSVTDQLTVLLDTLQLDAPNAEVNDLVNFILIDSKAGQYQTKPKKKELEALGVTVIDMPLVSEKSQPLIDPQNLVEILLSLT